MKRRVPRLRTDKEAEAFLETDLSDLDFSQFKSGRLHIGEGQSAELHEPGQSATYRLFERAMAERKQIFCMYEGYPRELCPIILGHSKGEEKALTYQFGGLGSSTLPANGQWKCLWLSKVSDAELRDGPWRSGTSHMAAQSCVEVVDLDVNLESPYSPKRQLAAVHAKKVVPGRLKRRTGRQSTKP